MSGPLAQILVRRGLAEPARARAFLAADEEHPPTAFAGIERAIEPILRHVGSGERITIHGDYDVDGICSTAVLVRSLRRLGANVDWYLPDRATDGYGLNPTTVQRLAQQGTRLLVTVDCAITAVEEVEAGEGARDGGRGHRPPCSPRRRSCCPMPRSCIPRSATTRAGICAPRRSPTSWPRCSSSAFASRDCAGCGRCPARCARTGGGSRPRGAGDDRRCSPARG